VLDTIQGIPVPNNILNLASKYNAAIVCRLSFSLFDVESGTFLGKTWKSPVAIPIVKQINDDDEDEDDPVDNYRAVLMGNKLNLQLNKQVFDTKTVHLFPYSTERKMFSIGHGSFI
jgi:hypothetical protein